VPPVGTIRPAQRHQAYKACDSRDDVEYNHHVDGLSQTFAGREPEEGQTEATS